MRKGLRAVADTSTIRRWAIFARIWSTVRILTVFLGAVVVVTAPFQLVSQDGPSLKELGLQWQLAWLLSVTAVLFFKAHSNSLAKSANGYENIWKYRRRLIGDIRCSRFEAQVFYETFLGRPALTTAAKLLGKMRGRSMLSC